MSDLKKNVWTLNGWYDQTVAGDGSYNLDDTFWAWGTNSYGRLGINKGQPSPVKYSSPVQVPGTAWSKIATGNPEGWGGLVQKTDGTLWTWGGNGYGTLGQNDVIAYSSPVQIGTDTNWNKICNGARHWLGIKTDGTLWACGSNQQGQLGDGESVGPGEYPSTKYSMSSPIQLPGTWSDIGCLTSANYAIKTNGTLWAWGTNTSGRLGQNEQYRPQYSSPVQVGSDTNWSKLFKTCDKFFLAIKTDGTLWGMGPSYGGNLGHRSPANNQGYSSPVQIPGTNWAECCGTYTSAYATKTDGTLWSWGANQYGELGHNERQQYHYSSPVQIGTRTDWTGGHAKIRAGQMAAFFVDSAGALFSVGSGSQGQRNTDTSGNVSSPVVIGGSWKDFGTGRYASQGIREW